MQHNLEMLNNYSDASSALVGLRERLSKGTPPTLQSPKTLPLDDIGIIAELFQPRDMRHDQLQSTYHIETLAKAIDASKNHTLDPISIWWTGDSWVVIDGHHRIDAYKLHQENLKEPGPRQGRRKHMSDKREASLVMQVPVAVFDGTILEATLHSTAANSQDKLAMSKDSKLTRAWQLVTVEWDELSLQSIAKCCAIHNRSVSNMRAVWRKAKNTCNTAQLGELRLLSWRQAQHWDKDAEKTTWGDKEVEAETNRLRDILIKTFGKTLLFKAAMFAEALERYSPALAVEIGKRLRHEEVYGWDEDFSNRGASDDLEWDEDERNRLYS
jgi:hypothetical protein